MIWWLMAWTVLLSGTYYCTYSSHNRNRLIAPSLQQQQIATADVKARSWATGQRRHDYGGDGVNSGLRPFTLRPITEDVTPRDGIWNPTIQSATTEIGKGAGKENDVQGRSSTGKHTLASPVDELVRWVPMLHWIHETTRASLESRALPDPSNQAVKTSDDLLRWRRVPASILRERSWDF